MANKKRSIPKPKSVIGKSSMKSISSEYAEVLRLRQAVRQAEMRNGRRSQMNSTVAEKANSKSSRSPVEMAS